MKLFRGRLAVFAMALVTAWSMWAFGQNKRHEGPGTPRQAPGHPAETRQVEVRKPAHVAEATAESGEKKHEESETEEPAPINWTDFGASTPPYIAMVINFGILVAGYYLLGRRPVLAALQGRRDAIAKEIELAARMKEEAEERAKVYQAKLARLEEEMALAREGLVRAGEAERDRIIADAEAKAERMRKDAEFLAAQELKQARQDLLRETVETAVQAAADLLQKRVTKSDQERLAEDYLADLSGLPGRKSAQPASGPSRTEMGTT